MVLGMATFWEVFWWMIIATFWILWIWMFITCFVDALRRPDISGWGKSGWVLLMLIFPFFGVLIYMASRPNRVEA